MPWNGSGVVTRTDGTRSGANVWQQAKAAGVRIRTDGHDTHDEDLASAIEECLHRGGQNALTASMNAGGFSITNLANATAEGEAVAYGQSTLQLISTDTGAAAAPALTLYRNSSSPAVDDALGTIIWNGEDSAGNEQFYAGITCEIADQTSASEDSRLVFSTMMDGTERAAFLIAAGGTYKFSGYSTGATVGPVVTLHRNSASPADADVLGSLNYDGEDDGGAQTTFASIAAVADDVTDSTEDGHFKIQAVRAGSLVGCTGPGILQGLFTTTGGTSLAICAAGTIHAEARRVTVMFNLSTNGTSQIILRLGDSSGLASTGYTSVAGDAGSTITNGLALNGGSQAADGYIGVLTITLQDASTNTWYANGVTLSGSGGNAACVGLVALSGALDRISITTAGGANTFDIVSANVLVE